MRTPLHGRAYLDQSFLVLKRGRYAHLPPKVSALLHDARTLASSARHFQDDTASGSVRHVSAVVAPVAALGGDLAVDAVDVALQVLSGSFDPGAVAESEFASHVVVALGHDLLGGAGGRDGGGVGGLDGRGLRGRGFRGRLGRGPRCVSPRDGGALAVNPGTDERQQHPDGEEDGHHLVRLFLLGRGLGVRGVDHGGCDLA